MGLTPRSWRVEQCTIDGFVNVAELRPVSMPGADLVADSGRLVAQNDIAAADAVLALFDIPDVLQQDFARPTVMLAASAASEGWKSHSFEIVAGSQRLATRTARRKTVLGFAVIIPEATDPDGTDSDASFEIQLIDKDQWLVSCDDEGLAGGSNLAVLGSELLQFGGAEPLGQGRWRLTRLLRGRADTEWAIDVHTVGEAFALIERDTLTAVELPTLGGAKVRASMRNLSGTISVSAPVTVRESLRR